MNTTDLFDDIAREYGFNYDTDIGKNVSFIAFKNVLRVPLWFLIQLEENMNYLHIPSYYSSEHFLTAKDIVYGLVFLCHKHADKRVCAKILNVITSAQIFKQEDIAELSSASFLSEFIINQYNDFLLYEGQAESPFVEIAKSIRIPSL